MNFSPDSPDLVLTLGKTQTEATEAVGTSRQTANQWPKRHVKAGEQALLDGRRIFLRKGKGLLTTVEAKRVRGCITDKFPGQLKLPYVLSTAGIVQELIHRRPGKNLGLSTVQLYMLRWGSRRKSPCRGPRNVPTLAGAGVSKTARSGKRRLYTGATRPA